MNKLRKTTATLLIAIFMISAFAVAIPVMSMEPCDSYEAAIIKAADRLIVTQNLDGGWDWPGPEIPNDPAEGPPSPVNTVGVTAQGILDAYKLTSDPEYLPALELAKGALKTLSDLVTLDPLSPLKTRIRGPDITFLVEIEEFTPITTNPDLAKEYYDKTVTRFDSVAGLISAVQAHRGIDTPLLAWDLNLYVQGALALERYYPGEYTGDAAIFAEAIYTNCIPLPTPPASSYVIGVSGALAAFITTGIHEDAVDELELLLLEAQDENGYYVDYYEDLPTNPGTFIEYISVQTTAYATMALLKTDNLVESIAAGDYFVANQLGDGSWISSSGGENSEVNSEVAQALYDILCMRKLNFVPGKGKGLDKIIPNDNFAKGRRKE